MNCQKCGSPLVPGDKFCTTCGTQVQDANQNMQQPMMTQMPSGMDNQMNNNMQQETQQPTQQHPLMMNQADLNMNAMTMNNNMNQMNDMSMNNQDNSLNMGNNQFVPQDNSMNQQPTMMDNNMNMQQPSMMDNNMNSMNNTNSMNGMSNMNSMNSMNSMNNMNNMNMGMNNMNSGMNNQIPQPMTPPTGMSMGINPGPMGAVTPKNNNSKFIIAGVAVVAVILVVVFLFAGNNSSLNGDEVGQTGDEEVEVATYTVQLSGFSFKVPQTYIYEVSNGYLMMTDESDSWIVRISVQKASYETLKTNMDQLKPTAEKKGYTAEAAEIVTMNGLEMIKFNFEASGMKYNGAYAKINSMYLATIEGFNEDNTYDESLLKKASSIVKSAEYVGETSNMEIAIPNGAIDLITLQ